jgi:hypothetical protein
MTNKRAEEVARLTIKLVENRVDRFTTPNGGLNYEILSTPTPKLTFGGRTALRNNKKIPFSKNF